MSLLAIDPGPEQSAWVVYHEATRRPDCWAKVPNDVMLAVIDRAGVDSLAVEMVASYGMAVGATVFDTCVWAGRFIERWRVDLGCHRGQPVVRRIFRREVKLHLCGSARAKDGNIRQALIDRYGPSKEQAIGRKASPGPLYGMAGDCWAALGVAVTAAEVPISPLVASLRIEAAA